jgi:hypothetical protein
MRATWEFNNSECKLIANALHELALAGYIEAEKMDAFAKLFAAFATSEKVRIECD